MRWRSHTRRGDTAASDCGHSFCRTIVAQWANVLADRLKLDLVEGTAECWHGAGLADLDTLTDFGIGERRIHKLGALARHTPTGAVAPAARAGEQLLYVERRL